MINPIDTKKNVWSWSLSAHNLKKYGCWAVQSINIWCQFLLVSVFKGVNVGKDKQKLPLFMDIYMKKMKSPQKWTDQFNIGTVKWKYEN